jgi:rhodanese-related sulfurtransferase
MKIMILTACFLTMLLPGIGLAADGYGVVTTLELKAMMDRKVTGLAVIDTRTPGEFQVGHIRGAINIPWVLIEKDPSLISYPKDAKIVFYCNGYS